MTESDQFKDFIKLYQDKINAYLIKEVYTSAVDYFSYSSSIGKLTDLFYRCGIDPLKLVDSVPSLFAYGSSMSSISIPDNIIFIDTEAFYGCSNLKSVIIGNKCNSIKSDAFAFCSSLTSITIPDSVTSIGNWAFYGCSSLTSITIPDSVTSIGSYAFEGCINLKTIYCKAKVQPLSWNALWSVGCSAKVVWGYKKPIPQIPISESFLDPEEKFWDYRTQDVDGEDVFDIARSESEYGQDYINNLNKEYNNKISTLEQLTPKEYFEACAKGFGKSVESQMRQISNDSEVIDHLKEVIQKYHKKFPLTYLDYSDHDFDQEGRHRMYTVGELFGWDKKFPVMIIKDVEGKALNLTIKRNRPAVSHRQERYILEDENKGALLYGDSQYDMLLKLQDMKEDLDKRVFSFLWNFIKDNKSSFR